MDGLSAAASIIAVVDISAKVLSTCRAYFLKVKGAKDDIIRLRNEVTLLQDVLTKVADLPEADDPSSAKLPIFSVLTTQDGPLQQCREELSKLDTKLDAGVGKKEMKEYGLRALKWPFSGGEVDKILANIERYKVTFGFVLVGDLVGLTRAIYNGVKGLQSGLDKLQIVQAVLQKEQKTISADARLQKIHHWLSPPDPSSNHNAACKKRQPTTGNWFLESDQFEEWKMSESSFLWLHGIPGCGKTILCSTIIQDVAQYFKSDPTIAVVYFYLDFNDFEKQRHENLLRSLVVQLSSQSTQGPGPLDSLFSRCQDGHQQPPLEGLQSTLRRMLSDFQQTFVFLDALDECSEREELMRLIEEIYGWNVDNLHILATSRREIDIEESLTPLITGQICIQSALVNADIHTHIRERLQNDSKLRKWPMNVQMEIEDTLMDGADGMFRWVVCQLDTVKKCLKLDALRRALKSLPQTLDDTYARILCNIDEEYSRDAYKILQWLAYSTRPLRIEEVAEVLAVEIDEDPYFDPQNRLPDPRDVLIICSSLITTANTTSPDDHGVIYEKEEVRLAHFSVKEYLISDRIRTGPASRYTIEDYAEEQIAKTCLTYLLYFNRPNLLTVDNFSGYWLAIYAAKYWTRHARKALNHTRQINQLTLELFQFKNEAYINWIRLHDLDQPWNGVTIRKQLNAVATPVYYAALAGLLEPTRLLLENGADVHAQGGYYCNALQAASAGGYETVVRLLLEKGADINAQGGYYGNALQVASVRGHEAVVQLLLDKGADVYAQSARYGSTLQAASVGGHEAVVKLLLEKGADVHAQGRYYGNALQAASARGHETVVQLLLEKGADVHAQGGHYGNALQAASEGGHEAVVQLLLEKGASVQAQGGHYGNALQAASEGGHEAVVQLLLEKGADIHAKGGHYGNALQAASARGHEAVVQLLLEKRASVQAQGGHYGNALQAVSGGGYETVVQLLLEKGADIHAHGGHYGNALQAASEGGHEAVVQLLLEKGADINAQGGHYGNALQAASEGGHEAVVQLLLEKGADIHAQGGHYDNALQAASARGYETVVQLLLEKGADVHAQGGRYGNALQAASARGCKAVVQLLLEKGSDVHAQGGGHSNALQAALKGGHEAVVQLLLEKGADFNFKAENTTTHYRRVHVK